MSDDTKSSDIPQEQPDAAKPDTPVADAKSIDDSESNIKSAAQKSTSKKKRRQVKKTVSLDPELAEVCSKIEKDYGKGSIMLCGSRGKIIVPVISTGALTLDLALGIGGVPRGRVVEIYGPESSGKTSLCLKIMANAQALGGRCAFVDLENAFDGSWANVSGVDVDNLLISQPDCGEDALNITEALIRSDRIDVLIVDSVAGLVPRAEIAGEVGDSHMGLVARLMSQSLRKLTQALTKSRTCVIFTNQIREKIGVMFGNPETTTGGNALKFYASIRLDLRRGDKISGEGKDAPPIGNEVRVKVVKNKLAPPFRKAVFPILYDRGISFEHTVITTAVEHGVIEKRGAWYAFGDQQLGQGFNAVVKVLRGDKEQLERVLAAIKTETLREISGEDDDQAPETDQAEPAD